MLARHCHSDAGITPATGPSAIDNSMSPSRAALYPKPGRWSRWHPRC